MPQISPEQALQYAPDESSVKAAKKLATINQWKILHRHSTSEGKALIWGEIMGSSLYQSSIILNDKFSFACDCPSFKKPCKHGIALLMCYAHSQHTFVDNADLPPWVNKHLAKQDEAEAKKAEKAAKPAKVIDEAAQAKRVAAREKKVETGIIELRLWLDDLIRAGLAHAKTLSYSHFRRAQERLIDAQATGLAAMIDSLQSALAHADWQREAATQVGKIQLLLSAYERIDTLPAALQADVRSLIGWNSPQEQVLATPASLDDWLIVGSQELEGDNNIRYRRQWLWGLNSQQAALTLTFAAGFQALSPALPTGLCFSGALCWYPSAWPQRVLIKEQGAVVQQPPITKLGFELIEQALQQQAQALAVNPFLTIMPWLFHSVVPQQHNGQWWLRDSAQQAIPLRVQNDIWPLLALSGGHPVTVFGEWDGRQLLALSAWHDGEVISL